MASVKYKDLEIHPTNSKQKHPDQDNLGFGKYFTDHMLIVEWDKKSGWKIPKIKKMENFSLHPGARTFHYAASGMKAMKGDDGKVRIFRPDENMKRMNITAKRCCLPLTKRLIQMDREWVPSGRNRSLYIRPTMISTDEVLGVHPPESALLYVLLCPVGFYYASGAKPVSLMADPQYVRAWPGGSGHTKMAANYAPTPYVQNIADKHNCQQVLWLFGKERYATEVGTMNFFVHLTTKDGEKQLVTHPLDGLILPGVTRKSVMELAAKGGVCNVVERRISMGEIVTAIKDGRIHEVFGTGTACVVSPVGKILYENEWLELPHVSDDKSLAKKLLKDLQDIQYGVEKNHPWAFDIDEI